MVNRRFAALLVLVPLALPGSAAAHFRLAGEFMMTGRITVAHAVPGEHVGQRVTRVWNFSAPCPVGQCRREKLVRFRAIGKDKVTLKRPKARIYSHWVGKGSFFAPLKCGSRVYPRGERVYFKIKVRIVRAAAIINGQQFATVIKARYTNYKRTNRTRCVAALGRDAAVYTGKLVMPVAPVAPVPPVPTPAPYSVNPAARADALATASRR